MSGGQWREAHGYDWYVTSSNDLGSTEVGMGLSIGYGRMNIDPRDHGVADVMCMCIATEIARPLEVSPGVFEEPQVYAELLGSRMEFQIHGSRAVVEGAWHRLVRCFDEPESLLPASPVVEASSAWMADSAYRTGVNASWVLALHQEGTYSADEFFERACELAREIAPSAGRWPCVFVTSDESLVGVGFTQKPQPFSVETLMRDAEQLTRVHDQPGSLWMMSSGFGLSTSLPLSAASVAAFQLVVRHVTQVANSVLREHVTPKVSLYPAGTELVLNCALPQLDSLPAIHEFVRRIVRESAPFDEGVAQIAEEVVNEDEVRLILRLRRAPEEIPNPEVIPELCREALKNLHIPAEVVPEELREHFPLLAGHDSVVNAFPFFADTPPEGIEPLSGADRVFTSKIHFDSAQYSNYTPHRVSCVGDRVVAEWFIEGHPNRGVARRFEVDLSRLAALYDMEGALLLLEEDASLLIFIPEALVRGAELEAFVRERARDVVLIRTKDQGGVEQVRQILRYEGKSGVLAQAGGQAFSAMPVNESPIRAGVRKGKKYWVGIAMFFAVLACLLWVIRLI